MRYGSLFTGGGGLDLAVQRLFPEAELAWWCENDKAAAEVFSRCEGAFAPNLNDITQVDWNLVTPVELMCGGFPCQDLSIAGRGEGIKKGTRSGLWFNFEEAIGILRPRLVLLENVASIVNRRPGFDVVLAGLTQLGYDCRWLCLRASDVGAAHRRDRWFLAAHARGERALEVPSQSRDTEWAKAVLNGSPGRAWLTLPTPQARDGKDTGINVNWPLVESKSKLTGSAAVHMHGGQFGKFTPAIERWAAIMRRPAPAATTPDKYLRAEFDEWLMGWPEGRVSGCETVGRIKQLRIIGNGVVPLQAEFAYRHLLSRA